MVTQGRAVILTGLTPPAGGSGNVYPNIADQLEYVPRTNLVEAWIAAYRSRITDTANVVSSWRGLNGNVAAAAGGTRPTYGATAINGTLPGIYGDGVDDVLLNTAVPMPASGFLAVAFQMPASPEATAALAGATMSADKAYIGWRTSGGNLVPAGAIGSLTLNNLSGTTPLVAGSRYVLSMQWHSGTPRLRLNGVQEATGAYTDGAPTTKNLAIGAYSSGAAGGLYSKAIATAVALYSGNDTVLDGAALAERDTAMGALVGLTI